MHNAFTSPTRRILPAWSDSALPASAPPQIAVGVQKERISETNEPVPLLMRPAVKEILQDAEQHRFDVLLIGNRDSLCCDAADMESFLTVLNSFNIHIFAGGQGSWVEPNGRHYAPLPRLPWQEDDVAEVPQ